MKVKKLFVFLKDESNNIEDKYELILLIYFCKDQI